MKMQTPISVLLFLVHANAVPYQPNNENGRFDQNVDGIDSLIDRTSKYRERIRTPEGKN